MVSAGSLINKCYKFQCYHIAKYRISICIVTFDTLLIEKTYTWDIEIFILCISEIETKKNYIPPSERQVDQDLRRYMGSSIPSRSFKMLQAMTATQDPTG